MQIQLESQPYASIETDALVTYVFDREDKFDGVLADINVAMSGRLSALAASGELTGKSLEMILIHFPQGLAAQRLLLVGAGKPGKFAVSDLRKIAGAALRYLKPRGVKKVVFLAREGERSPEAAQAVVEGFEAANFESDTYHTEKKKREIQSVSLAGFEGGLGDSLQMAVEHGCVIGESQNFARRADQRALEYSDASRSRAARGGDGEGSRSGRRCSGRAQDRRAENGRVDRRGPGKRRAAARDRGALRAADAAPRGAGARTGWQRRSPSIRAASRSSRRTTWRR